MLESKRNSGMKKIVVWIVINSLVLQLTGCYTFTELSGTEVTKEELIRENNILINLNSGGDIYSEVPFHQPYADTSDYLIGQGQLYDLGSNTSKTFCGQIYLADIDSSRYYNNFIYLWLNTKQKVVFVKNNYQEFAPDYKTGYILTDRGEITKIESNEIKSIEIEEFNWPLSILYGTTMVVALAGLVIGFISVINIGPIFQ